MAPASGFHIIPSGIGLRRYEWPFTKLAANPWESSSTRAEACGRKGPTDFYDWAYSNFLVLRAFGLNGKRARGA